MRDEVPGWMARKSRQFWIKILIFWTSVSAANSGGWEVHGRDSRRSQVKGPTVLDYASRVDPSPRPRDSRGPPIISRLGIRVYLLHF